MRALELDCDHLVVGGGLAGTVAALRLPGDVVLLSGGLGATAISSGVFHPAGADAPAEDWFLGIMAGAYVRGCCTTGTGIRRFGLVPASAACEAPAMPVAINEHRPGFRRIEFMAGRSHMEIARTLEDDDHAVDMLCEALAGIGADALLLPPVLGIGRAEEIRGRVGKSLGADVREYAMAPSVLGLRLLQAMKKKAGEKQRLRALDFVRATRVSNGHVDGVMGVKGLRDVRVYADSLFIATGGPMTGLTTNGGRLFEPLTGASVSMDFVADTGERFLSRHPLMYKGLEPELHIRGFGSVRPIGAVARGFGLYEALASGYHAGDGLE